ncbi:MAG TPA: hypothetical protein VFX43_16135 [Chitinophagaceae bacterium]|jgi:hypothetical protein|nr:hypothetical protein [Chitinophagaceae bacterium]
MKIFNRIGIAAVIVLIVSAFLPWAYIDFGLLHNALLTGMDTGATTYGKPGILNIFFGVLFLATVLIPKLWAKRIGIFLGVVILAWNLRNYFLFHCEMGYCPDRRIGLYLSLLAGIAIMVCAVLPYVPEKEEKKY